MYDSYVSGYDICMKDMYQATMGLVATAEIGADWNELGCRLQN